jgi:hypothetical protein
MAILFFIILFVIIHFSFNINEAVEFLALSNSSEPTSVRCHFLTTTHLFVVALPYFGVVLFLLFVVFIFIFIFSPALLAGRPG